MCESFYFLKKEPNGLYIRDIQAEGFSVFWACVLARNCMVSYSDSVALPPWGPISGGKLSHDSHIQNSTSLRGEVASSAVCIFHHKYS